MCEETIGKVSIDLQRCTAVNTKLEENMRERKVKNKIF